MNEMRNTFLCFLKFCHQENFEKSDFKGKFEKMQPPKVLL